MSLIETVEFEDNGKVYRVVRDAMHFRNNESVFPVPGKRYYVLWNPVGDKGPGWGVVTDQPRVRNSDRSDLEPVVWQIRYELKKKIRKYLKAFRTKFFPDKRWFQDWQKQMLKMSELTRET